MWRSLFLAFGIMAIIVGVESMLIEHANLYEAVEPNAAEFMDPSGPPGYTTKAWTPGEAFPWALLFIGGVVVLYAFTLPQRFRGHAAE